MRRRAAAVATLAVLLTSAGCGTRLSDSAFLPARSPVPSSSATSSLPPIPIGNIVSRTNFFDPRAFVGAYYGVKAYVDSVNAAGGVGGRALQLFTCDDQGNATVNVTCVRRLLDDDKVFALVGNAVLNYGGAPLVQSRGVPDVGSQPVDNVYVRYSHLWDVLGESAPRDGKVGWNGVRYNGTEIYRYFKTRYPKVPLRAAVVSYNQSSSLAFGKAIATGLRAEGYTVTQLQVNIALPDFDSLAVAMRHDGVAYVFDAMDRSGNVRLCKALDDARLTPAAKVTTTQNWDANVRADYADSPSCRNVIYATGSARNYDDKDIPAVAEFRRAMAAEGWDKPTTMSEWALEGWAGAQWFVDALRSCGSEPSRGCVESYLARPTPYDGHGLLIPRDFVVARTHPTRSHNCFNVARWSDAANAGAGGWVTQVADMTTNCFDVPALPYRP
jgi:ABC-type branched-subunit amino acid transport system substrate-binding protein